MTQDHLERQCSELYDVIQNISKEIDKMEEEDSQKVEDLKNYIFEIAEMVESQSSLIDLFQKNREVKEIQLKETLENVSNSLKEETKKLKKQNIEVEKVKDSILANFKEIKLKIKENYGSLSQEMTDQNDSLRVSSDNHLIITERFRKLEDDYRLFKEIRKEEERMKEQNLVNAKHLEQMNSDLKFESQMKNIQTKAQDFASQILNQNTQKLKKKQKNKISKTKKKRKLMNFL